MTYADAGRVDTTRGFRSNRPMSRHGSARSRFRTSAVESLKGSRTASMAEAAQALRAGRLSASDLVESSLEAIAAHQGVTPDWVVTAQGTSFANYLAMAAILDPGDEVLIERPAYGLLIDAALQIGARVQVRSLRPGGRNPACRRTGRGSRAPAMARRRVRRKRPAIPAAPGRPPPSPRPSPRRAAPTSCACGWR